MARGKEANLKERYAAALLHLEAARCVIDPTLQACIDREKAKHLTPEQIIGHFEVDHYPVPKALGGSNHPTNLNPVAKAGHRHKTAKKDQPVIAKVRRSVREKKFEVQRPVFTVSEEALEDVMKDPEGFGLKLQGALKQSQKFTKAKKAWPKRKMQSRGFSKSSGPISK